MESESDKSADTDLEDHAMGECEGESDAMFMPMHYTSPQVDEIKCTRMACMAHALQLLVREVCNTEWFKVCLTKCKSLVKKIRHSFILMESILTRYGKVVVSDCVTR